MQYPSELEQFLLFMKNNHVKSYLEIGVGSGHLVSLVDGFLKPDKAYACDVRFPDCLKDHPSIEFCHDSCYGKHYLEWRNSLGHIDMVFVDAIHRRRFIRKDYNREKLFPHRFLAFHDIANKRYPKLSKFWKRKVAGQKIIFVNTNPEENLISLQKTKEKYAYKKKYGTSCGIGICWEK
ncbi:hypothetical protein LCGC14_1745390 [marine sediment metagenome]|uniref:Class I SAM-dependent methyltransferase n=1 Tax=marine sediment metagenome TaxID=412755 RepID=A0A0F9H5I9_9ZZZZ